MGIALKMQGYSMNSTDYTQLRAAADLLIQAIDRVISEKTVTFDLAEMISGSTELTCSAYGDKLVETLS